MRAALVVSILLAATSPSTSASAHFRMIAPVSRYGGDAGVIKRPPCGITGGARSANAHRFAPGETIHLQWDEYIAHPGHYRVAFDVDGDDAFVDPATATELFSNDAVILDDVSSGALGTHELDVTLPDVECANCTLQIIQVMTDHGAYGDGDDIYYQCLDLVLTREPLPDAGAVDAGSQRDAGPLRDASADGGSVTAPTTGGCSCAAGGARDGTAALLGLVTLATILRRRTSRGRQPPI